MNMYKGGSKEGFRDWLGNWLKRISAEKNIDCVLGCLEIGKVMKKHLDPF